MRRKTIKTLDEMPDTELFQNGIDITYIQKMWRSGEPKGRLFGELASISKRFINEGVAFEALLSEPGMKNVSAAIYALEWKDLYYAAEAERQSRAKRGYWKCLWDALCNKA